MEIIVASKFDVASYCAIAAFNWQATDTNLRPKTALNSPLSMTNGSSRPLSWFWCETMRCSVIAKGIRRLRYNAAFPCGGIPDDYGAASARPKEKL